MRRRLALVVALALPAALWQTGSALGQGGPPQTGFEQTNGASWTTHAEEVAFLQAVAAGSPRVRLEQIGTTLQGRPLHLVTVGEPAPGTLADAQAKPTIMYVCTQHGNEPAGREACLKALRDLAFTTDPTLVQQLRDTVFLFVPSANPDGRNANSRGNSQGVDINRDHLNLKTLEAKAIARVVRDWKPDLSIDLHEYGPGSPVLYDDDLLYLWPRNLNVERSIHDLAKSFAVDHVVPCAAAAGYTSDEYGQDAVADQNIQQTAGDQDEGIMRNTMGLRHSLGILFETAVSQSNNPQQIPTEAGSTPAQMRRRVTTHRTLIDCSLSWMRTKGAEVKRATDTAPLRKEGEGLAQNQPSYFGGADNTTPPTSEVVYPPPCYYRLTPAQATQSGTLRDLHGIQGVAQEDGTLRVPLGQPAEPVVPLLFDARGDRKELTATAVPGDPLAEECGLPEPEEESHGAPAAGALGLLALGEGLRRRVKARPGSASPPRAVRARV